MEELWDEINKLKATIEELQRNDKRKDNIIEGQQLSIEKLNRIARSVNLVNMEVRR